jgi:hypothetical protein
VTAAALRRCSGARSRAARRRTARASRYRPGPRSPPGPQRSMRSPCGRSSSVHREVRTVADRSNPQAHVSEPWTSRTVSSCAPVEGDCPALVYVDPTGSALGALADRVLVTIGRRPEADISLPWDSEVSRLHAELLDRASEWLIIDDGLSQNGTYVNSVRVEGRRRLADGDLITVGRTSLTCCCPRSPPSTSRRAGRASADPNLFRSASARAAQPLPAPPPRRRRCAPASDEEVDEELGLPLGVVGRELDAVAHSFGFADLPLEERRLRTALSALGSGIVPPG